MKPCFFYQIVVKILVFEEISKRVERTKELLRKRSLKSLTVSRCVRHRQQSFPLGRHQVIPDDSSQSEPPGIGM